MDIIILLLLGALFLGVFFYELFFAPSIFDGLPDPISDRKENKNENSI